MHLRHSRIILGAPLPYSAFWFTGEVIGPTGKLSQVPTLLIFIKIEILSIFTDKTSKAKFKITTPRAPAGSYLLKCSFDDAAKTFEAPSLTFKYYNNTGIVINGISSSIVSVNAQNISVTGSGFSMTGNCL